MGFVPLVLMPVARAMASSCLSLQVRSQLRWVAIHFSSLDCELSAMMLVLRGSYKD